MTKEQASRDVVKMLKKAGRVPASTFVGGPRKRTAPNGKTLSIPEGHKMISPGVMRQIEKALEEWK